MKKGLRSFEYRYDRYKQGQNLNLLYSVLYFLFFFFLIYIVLNIPFSLIFKDNATAILICIAGAVGIVFASINAFKVKKLYAFNDYIQLVNFTLKSLKIRYSEIKEVRVVEIGKTPFKDRIYGVGNNYLLITYGNKKKIKLSIDENEPFIELLKNKNPYIIFLVPNDEARLEYSDILGKRVTVVVDCPFGSYHPENKDIFYSVNYGYVPDMMAGDNEEQDAYILGLSVPLERFEGNVVAVIHRKNDVEDKLVVVPDGVTLTRDEIKEQTAFQEKYFDIEIIC